MRSEVLFLVGCGLGALLGVFVFGGLWLTVRSIMRVRRPRLLFLASYVVRIGSGGITFALLGKAGFPAVCGGILGLFVCRQLFLRRVAGFGQGRAAGTG